MKLLVQIAYYNILSYYYKHIFKNPYKVHSLKYKVLRDISMYFNVVMITVRKKENKEIWPRL